MVRSPSDPIESPLDEWPSDWRAPAYNNAAGRLYVVLERMMNEKNNEGVAHVGWRRCLFPEDRKLPWESKLEGDDWAKLTTAISGVYQMVLEVEREINERHAKHAAALSQVMPDLKKLFTPDNLVTSFGVHRHLITDKMMAHLEHCAIELENEPLPDEDELRAVWSATEELFDLVGRTEMPKPLKQTLTTLLANIQHSIIYYRTNGTKGLKDALEVFSGVVFINRKQIEAMPEVKTGLGKLWGSLAKVVTTLDTFVRLEGLAEKSLPLLDSAMDMF